MTASVLMWPVAGPGIAAAVWVLNRYGSACSTNLPAAEGLMQYLPNHLADNRIGKQLHDVIQMQVLVDI